MYLNFQASPNRPPFPEGVHALNVAISIILQLFENPNQIGEVGPKLSFISPKYFQIDV